MFAYLCQGAHSEETWQPQSRSCCFSSNPPPFQTPQTQIPVSTATLPCV